MFIKTVKIKNFKCFDKDDRSLDFNTPDGTTAGSGLNIFVGPNNTGKSTVFECIDFLRDHSGRSESDLKNKGASKQDEVSVELTFTGDITNVIENFSQGNKKDAFKKCICIDDDSGGEQLTLRRSSKKEIKTIEILSNDGLKSDNPAGIDAALKKLFDLNFIWSDSNPSDQMKFGATTICGSLLKEIMRQFGETEDYSDLSEQFNVTFNSESSGLRQQLKSVEERTQEIFREQFGDATISFRFDDPKIDTFFKNTRVKIDDGILTDIEDKGSGMQRSVALAMLQVYAEELSRHPEKADTSKPFFLFIDEPELCLHPEAQLKLLGAIVELSRTKQIFVATHSPYFFRHPSYKDTGLFIFKKDDANKIDIQNINNSDWGKLPWSPSWGEINYHAYNIATEEFHNELYGYLHEQSKQRSVSEFDAYLQTSKKITNIRPYMQSGGPKQNLTLCSYIRNQIHHPENTNNAKYSDGDLAESIELLLSAI